MDRGRGGWEGTERAGSVESCAEFCGKVLE